MKFLSYINGISYVFEGFMINEFTYSIQCPSSQIVPFNQPRDAAFQSCAFAGNKRGSLFVEGSDYLSASFGYSHTHLWRNVGVVIACTALYIIPTIFAPTKRAKCAVRQSQAQRDDLEGNSVRETNVGNPLDLVSKCSGSDRTAQTSTSDDKKRCPDLDQKPIFTWKDVNYTIDWHHLLDNIDGYVKPGEMTVCFRYSIGLHPLNEIITRRR
jgi:ATP-binding cassette, subfamily G (WHITE), member 2, SNQ2